MTTIQKLLVCYTADAEKKVNELIANDWKVVSMVAGDNGTPHGGKLAFLLEKYEPERSEGAMIGKPDVKKLPPQ